MYLHLNLSYKNVFLSNFSSCVCAIVKKLQKHMIRG